ncbi:MAG TPA: DMT family transporter [Thermoanaerobaculia bacterium]|nr:DMT family transporter [Thermoanaerobaculia bacterium]
MPSRLRVHTALFAVAFFFSLNYLISKLGMRAFAPLVFAWLRVVGSAIVLALVVRYDSTPPLAGRDAKRVTLFSLLGVVFNQTLFLGGLALTSVHVAAILITTIPVFALAAAIALGRERATANKIGGIALAAAGALLVVGGEGFHGTARSLLGAVMIVGNCLCYALYLVLSKPDMARLSPRRVVAWMFGMGALLMLPISAWSLAHQQWRTIPPSAWLALALVIAGPTVGAYLINAWTLRHAESSVVAAYTYVQPVLATILGALFLGETMHATLILAAAMIFAGVWLAGRGNS